MRLLHVWFHNWRKRFFMDRVRKQEECIVQAIVSSGFLLGRFDGMTFGPGPSHTCVPPHMKAVLRQVANGDSLNNIMAR